MKNFPSKAEVIRWIEENPTKTNKRDVGRAFGIKGAARIDLKRMLKELTAEGVLKKSRKAYRDPESLPPVSVVAITGPDSDGDLFAVPVEWEGEATPPRILMIAKMGEKALAAGERILARLEPVKDQDHAYEGRLIRNIGSAPSKLLGLFRVGSDSNRIVPIDKKSDNEWLVPDGATHGAKDGE
ncbi:MAG: ribonuclease R, partial [Paracoccaceae bacterium]